MQDDVAYLERIIVGLIGYPEDLHIEKTIDDRGVLLTVSVSKADMGKIIGKEGNTARAIRTIMHSYGYNAKQVFFVKILEPIN
jgi:predicted RNA-binding protein YlqC (UPF0109 family)